MFKQGLILIWLALAIAGWRLGKTIATWDQLTLVVCDVGQGDAIWASWRSIQVLIDGGPDSEKLATCLANHQPFFDRQLEVLVITHSDQDHIGGLPPIIKKYRPQLVFFSDWQPSVGFQDLTASLVDSQIPLAQIQSAGAGQVIKLSPAWQLKILAPLTSLLTANEPAELCSPESWLQLPDQPSCQLPEEHNDRSIVLLMQYNQFEILLMGDASQQVELALTRQRVIKEVEWLKVGHHGSKTSTSLDFLAQAQPEQAAISVGQNNNFGHPAIEILELLQQSGVVVHRTDRQSELILQTDGNFYW